MGGKSTAIPGYLCVGSTVSYQMWGAAGCSVRYLQCDKNTLVLEGRQLPEVLLHVQETLGVYSREIKPSYSRKSCAGIIVRT